MNRITKRRHNKKFRMDFQRKKFSTYRGIRKRRPVSEIERCESLVAKMQYKQLIKQFCDQSQCLRPHTFDFYGTQQKTSLSTKPQVVGFVDLSKDDPTSSNPYDVESSKSMTSPRKLMDNKTEAPKNPIQASEIKNSNSFSDRVSTSPNPTQITTTETEKPKSQQVTPPTPELSKVLSEDIVCEEENSVINGDFIKKILDEHKKKEMLLKEQMEHQKAIAERCEIEREQIKKQLSEQLKLKLKLETSFDEELPEDEEEEEEEEVGIRELTSDEDDIVDDALVPNPSYELLVEGFNIRITRDLLNALKGMNWLNDEVINFYFEMIKERSTNNSALPQIHIMNTFFYPKLSQQGYRSVRRWTKKVDIFSKQIVFYPVHLGVHWTLAVVDFRSKEISYYDSMGGRNNACLNCLRKYLEEEHNDKKKVQYDTSDWQLINMCKNVPQQLNGSDCGVFTCMFAEFISRNAEFEFSQGDMPLLRRTMALEILNTKLDR